MTTVEATASDVIDAAQQAATGLRTDRLAVGEGETLIPAPAVQMEVMTGETDAATVHDHRMAIVIIKNTNTGAVATIALALGAIIRSNH
jgi:hypothetical protein